MALMYRGKKVRFFFNWKKDYINNLMCLANNLADKRDLLKSISDQDAQKTFRIVENAYYIVYRLIRVPNRFSKEDQIMVFESLTDIYDSMISPNITEGYIRHYIIQSYIGLMILFLSANFNATGEIRMTQETLADEMKKAGNLAAYLECQDNYYRLRDEYHKVMELLEEYEAEAESMGQWKDALVESESSVFSTLQARLDDFKVKIRAQKKRLLNARNEHDNYEKALAILQRYSKESESIIDAMEILSINNVLDLYEFQRFYDERIEIRKEIRKNTIVD